MEVSTFLQDMKKERTDQIKSVMYFFQNTDDIQKGIASELSYNEEFSKLDKKGSEIKEKLVSYKHEVISKISDCSVKMGELKAKIGQEPDNTEGVKSRMYDSGISEAMPVKTYHHSEIYKEGAEESKEMKMLYNNLAYKLCDMKRELKLTDTLIDNVKVEKMYKLPVRVASMLGF